MAVLYPVGPFPGLKINKEFIRGLLEEMDGTKKEKKVPPKALEVANFAANLLSKYMERLYACNRAYGIRKGVIPLQSADPEENPLKKINAAFLATSYKFSCLIGTTMDLLCKQHPSINYISFEHNKDPRRTISLIEIHIT